MRSLPIQIRHFDDSDSATVCSWVPTSAELSRISSDPGDHLSPDLLRRWRLHSLDVLVLQCGNIPVAFCTLSTKEWDLPKGYIEACHLVTAPRHRRKYFATTLLNYLRLLAAQRSYCRLVGRVADTNTPGLRLARYVHWKPLSGNPSPFDSQFHWFAYDLRN